MLCLSGGELPVTRLRMQPYTIGPESWGGGDYVPQQEVSEQVTLICHFAHELGGDKLEKLKTELLGLADFGFEPRGRL